MISQAPLHALVARVVRRLDDWKDAEDRYRSPRSGGRAWADLPKSIGAEFIRNQIASAQEELRSMRDELAALLFTAGAAPAQEPAMLPRAKECKSCGRTQLMALAFCGYCGQSYLAATSAGAAPTQKGICENCLRQTVMAVRTCLVCRGEVRCHVIPVGTGVVALDDEIIATIRTWLARETHTITTNPCPELVEEARRILRRLVER